MKPTLIVTVAGLALSFALGLVACKHDHGHDHDQASDHTHASAPSDDHKPDGTIPKAFELDDGKRWQMDDHTRASVGRMRDLIAQAGDDPAALGASLEDELETLIGGCTMKGPAHQQLHIFIAALFPRLATLKGGGKEAGVALIEVKTLLERYDAAFE